MRELSLSVATNFDDGLLDAFSAYPVTEVFGKLSSDAVGGGRASFTLPPLSRRRFERHVEKARSKGIGFNYLLNPACMDNREFTRQGQREIEALLEYVETAGVSAVTISLPFLLPVIKKRHPGLKVRVGVYARVDGVTKARACPDFRVSGSGGRWVLPERTGRHGDSGRGSERAFGRLQEAGGSAGA